INDYIGVLKDDIVCTDISEDIKIDVEDVINCDVKPGDKLTKTKIENLIENANSRTSSKKLGLSEKKIRSKDPYPCSLCNFEATSKIGLRKHKASEHKRILPQCAQCGYSAQNLKELRIHVKNNVACRTNPVNNQKEYLCDQCEFTTRLPTYLKLHMQAAHENIRYPCHLCDYK
ncbi:zinc finger protein 142, partial [Eurytemora carolleeae]|uniref:zinc finger protein 142 n=1 Tax=Eurytemora carolleeae TaxID=1294199 RepID=UPI000C76BB64